MMHGEAWQDVQFQVIQTRISRGKKRFKLIIEKDRETLNAVLKVKSTIYLPIFVLVRLVPKSKLFRFSLFLLMLFYFRLSEQKHIWMYICEFYEVWVKNDKITLFRNSACFFYTSRYKPNLKIGDLTQRSQSHNFWNSIIRAISLKYLSKSNKKQNR